MEPLFRCWQENTNNYVYQGNPDLETLSSFIFHYGKKELEQWTTLEVKGVKLFEGDIVIWSDSRLDGTDFNYTCEVVWDDKFVGWGLENEEFIELGNIPLGMYGAKIEELVIVGNKHKKIIS